VQYVFYGLRGCQTQGPPRATHTLATPRRGFGKFHRVLATLRDFKKLDIAPVPHTAWKF